MHGHANNIVDVMLGFDVFVNTFIHEGMPMSVSGGYVMWSTSGMYSCRWYERNHTKHTEWYVN